MIRRITLVCAAVLLVAASGAEAKKTKLTVRVTPATVTAGTPVKVTIKGTKRTKCSLTVRADRKGSKVSVRHRVKRSSKLAIPASSAAGRRIVSARCGNAKASKRFTVTAAVAVQPSPGATPAPTNVGNGKLGMLPLDADEVAGYKVAGNVGGRGFSTRVPFATGTRVRVSQGANGGYSHQDVNSKNAVDLDMPADTPILAGFSGVIAAVRGGCDATTPSGCNGGWGNFVLLKHVDGTCAIHAHMKAIMVAAGQQIDRYTQLGTVGASGYANGPHLHYDHIDCGSQISLPWQFDDIGIPAQGEFVVSNNEPLPAGATPTPAPTAVPTAVPTAAPTPAPTAAPPPSPSVNIGKGAHVSNASCNSSACAYINVSWANFSGGGHSVVCRASNGDEGGFAPHTVQGGSGSEAYCYYGWPGRSVWVTIDGVSSNTIGW